MRFLPGVLALLGLSNVACSPEPSDNPELPRTDTPALREALQQRAGPYPLDSVVFFGNDSALVVLADSSYTGEKVRAGTWMFGPPVTPEEAGKCPPEKVLGQRIARVLWWHHGADTTLQTVIVRVHGTEGADRFSSTSMYYYLQQLREPWVGDTLVRSER